MLAAVLGLGLSTLGVGGCTQKAKTGSYNLVVTPDAGLNRVEVDLVGVMLVDKGDADATRVCDGPLGGLEVSDGVTGDDEVDAGGYASSDEEVECVEGDGGAVVAAAVAVGFAETVEREVYLSEAAALVRKFGGHAEAAGGEVGDESYAAGMVCDGEEVVSEHALAAAERDVEDTLGGECGEPGEDLFAGLLCAVGRGVDVAAGAACVAAACEEEVDLGGGGEVSARVVPALLVGEAELGGEGAIDEEERGRIVGGDDGAEVFGPDLHAGSAGGGSVVGVVAERGKRSASVWKTAVAATALQSMNWTTLPTELELGLKPACRRSSPGWPSMAAASSSRVRCSVW
jgi:hypothetical protein